MSITKVARAAGVSHATVSNVINHRPNVSAATVKAVRRAIEAVGYVPRPVGRRPGRRPRSADGVYTGVVTLVWPRGEREPRGARRQQNPTLLGVMQGVADELRRHGLNLSVWFDEPGDADDDGADDGARGVAGIGDAGAEVAETAARSDGLLIISFHDRQVLQAFRAKPVVWIGSLGPTDWGDRVRSDHAQIARDAVDYLNGHGRTDLVYVNLDAPHPAFAQRRNAFRDEAERLGLGLTLLEPRPDPAVDAASPVASINRRAAEAAGRLKSMGRSGALARAGLFVACDRHLGALDRECRRLGLNLTAELPVIGCDNDASALAGVSPAPATFDLHPDRMGRLAVRRLVERMRGDDTPGQTTVATPAERVDPEPRELDPADPAP